MRRLPAVVVSLVLLTAAPAVAQEQQLSTTIEVGVQLAAKAELSDYAVAVLRDSDGQPIGNAEISFGVEVDLLGSRTAALGTALTDATGTARFPIVARESTQVVEATYGGGDIHQPSTGSAELRFPDERVVPAIVTPPSSRLTSLRIVTPRVIGILVAGLWLFFVLATLYVVRSVRRRGISEPLV